MVKSRYLIPILSAVLLSATGCGGGGSSSSNGNGSGSGNTAPSISQLTPSSMMTGIPLGGVKVIGKGLLATSQILIDGSPVPTFPVDLTTLQAQIPLSFWTAIGVHQFSIQTGKQTSNSLPFTVYTPQSGPQVM